VFHPGEGLGGVAAGGPAGGVGEGAVVSGAVVAHRVDPEDLATGGDLDVLANDRDLNLASSVCAAGSVVAPGEGDVA